MHECTGVALRAQSDFTNGKRHLCYHTEGPPPRPLSYPPKGAFIVALLAVTIFLPRATHQLCSLYNFAELPLHASQVGTFAAVYLMGILLMVLRNPKFVRAGK